MIFSAIKKLHALLSTCEEMHTSPLSQPQYKNDVLGFDECFALMNLHSRPAVATGLLFLTQAKTPDGDNRKHHSLTTVESRSSTQDVLTQVPTFL